MDFILNKEKNLKMLITIKKCRNIKYNQKLI